MCRRRAPMRNLPTGTPGLVITSPTGPRTSTEGVTALQPDSSLASAEDHRDATEIATAAGSMLLDLQARLRASRRPPSERRQEADQAANELIMALLAARHPHDPVLSEESLDDPCRLLSRRVWIV